MLSHIAIPWSPDHDPMNARSAKLPIQMLSNVILELKNEGHLNGARRHYTLNFQFRVDFAQAPRCIHHVHISGSILWNGTMLVSA